MPGVTLGRLSAGSFASFTLECPWRSNEPFVSCMPEGFYQVTRTHSIKYGMCYSIEVPGRDHMLFHPANWVHQLQGCVALGEYVDPKNYNEHGAMVSRSKVTVEKFLLSLEGFTTFKLQAEKEAAAAELAAKAQEDANEEGKHIYTCLHAVRHNGRRYTETVTLTEDEAAPLLKSKAITK